LSKTHTPSACDLLEKKEEISELEALKSPTLVTSWKLGAQSKNPATYILQMPLKPALFKFLKF
jgi:hypothetical protein